MDSLSFFLTVLILFVVNGEIQNGNRTQASRYLKEGSKTNRRLGKKLKITKEMRLTRLVSKVTSLPAPESFKPESWCKSHNPNSKYVIFSVAISAGVSIYTSNVHNFVGTARKVGIEGDIVIGTMTSPEDSIYSALRSYDAIVYSSMNITTCSGSKYNVYCKIYGLQQAYSVNLARYFMYKWWAAKYYPDTLIMISDFRDVFFQSNPFLYRPQEWTPPASQLVVFQEAHPNAVINRCKFNRGWIKNCFGDEGLDQIGHNTVSCSGVSIGTRDAILAYTHTLTELVHPTSRHHQATNTNKDNCVTNAGVDQGFHNWLIYSGTLDKYMTVRIFAQGEGPVNTVGGFYGERKLLKFSLEKWGVLKGNAPNAYISNWNGDKSPVVHQFDRFRSDMGSYMGAVQGLPNE